MQLQSVLSDDSPVQLKLLEVRDQSLEGFVRKQPLDSDETFLSTWPVKYVKIEEMWPCCGCW
jgi:hypothetical protein